MADERQHGDFLEQCSQSIAKNFGSRGGASGFKDEHLRQLTLPLPLTLALALALALALTLTLTLTLTKDEHLRQLHQFQCWVQLEARLGVRVGVGLEH